MPKIDIAVRNVSKRYRIPRSQLDRTSSFFNRLWCGKREVWALQKVTFQVYRGEALGIVGHNGAGKSTLVKLLSGITVPTSGEVIIRGTLSALVEVGAGFSAELTGRENVFLQGAILGMDRAEISRKLDDIVEFAGIGEYIDAPVKNYSSGQFLRLGFAIAAQLDQQIFLLDEVLAVGDVAFQTRCFDRIDRLRKAGRTIVLVSHDLAAVERICDRAILFSRGELIMTGSPRSVIEEYCNTVYAALLNAPGSTTSAKLVAVSFEGPAGGPVRTGQSMRARVSILLTDEAPSAALSISLYWPSGYLCTQLSSSDGGETYAIGPGPVSFDFSCAVLTMQRGLYRVDIALRRGNEIIGDWRCCSLLRVDPGKIIAGDFYLQHSCKMSNGADQLGTPTSTESGPKTLFGERT
jgi:ABC-type polysaccharide/polyol phosphate transport system ATPase subunit